MLTKRTDSSRLITGSDDSPHDRPEHSFSRFSTHALPNPKSSSYTQKEARSRTSHSTSRISRLETQQSHHKEPELTRMDPIYVSRLETIIEQKNQEINKMLHLNGFLEKAVKKREELAKLYFEENTKLKETLKNKDKTIEIFKRKLEDALKSQPQISTVTLPEGSSIRFLPRGSTAGSGSKTDRFSKTNETLEARESTRNLGEMTLGGDGPWVLTERKGSTGINFAPKRSLSTASLVRQTKQQKLQDIVEEKGVAQPKERVAIDVRTKPTLTMKAVKVTESQGRKDFESMFLGGSGRVSVLDMEDKDFKKMLSDGKLKDFEELLADTDKFRDMVRKSSDQKLGDLMDVVKSLVKDFKNLLGIVLSLKKLVKANSSISVSLILNDALETIVSEACNILHCDRASVFIVDEANQELWTKVARGSNSTIRIPINSGIAGHVVSTGRSVRIDEAYLDPRFNQDVDKRGHYRTKTILAVPIKDFTQRVIGVCQAINKHDGIFSPDDEGICQLLANQAGVMLKNSLQFDQNLVTHQKLIRLLKIGSEMYEANRYSILIQKIENGLKEIMLSNKAYAYIINEKGDSFFNFDEDGTMVVYPINSGIVGHVAQTGEMMDIPDPYNHPYFNSLVDIETKLPVLCLPVFSTKNPKKVIAVMQTLDLKIAGRGGGKQDLIESETIRLFQIQIGVCLEQFAKLKALQADLQEEKDQVRKGFNS